MKTIFWDVDTQYDFMRSDGKLYVPGAEEIEGKLAGLTKFAKDNGIKVVNSADWHNKFTKEISSNPDYVNTFPEHCMQNTPGAKYVAATDPEDPYVVDWAAKSFDPEKVRNSRNIVLYKDKFDVFTGNPHTEGVLNLISPDAVVVYGVAANVCDDYAIMGFLERKVRTFVAMDAIKELPGLPLPYEKWKDNGAILTTTDEVYRMLK